VPCLIQNRHSSLIVDASQNTAVGSLAIGIDTGKVLAKVAEDGSKEAKRVSDDNVYTLRVAVVGNFVSLFRCDIRENYGLILVELRVIIKSDNELEHIN
jgi:hypothetical protein